MERQIGATDLRQRLTDVLSEVREEGVSYIIETFGRPQAALISLEDYHQYQQYQQEREGFFEWLDRAAAINAEHNRGLSEAEVLALIEEARDEVAEEK